MSLITVFNVPFEDYALLNDKKVGLISLKKIKSFNGTKSNS